MTTDDIMVLATAYADERVLAVRGRSTEQDVVTTNADLREAIDKLVAETRAAALEEAAGVAEEVHGRYPTDVFPDGTSVDAQSAKMARITANNCAAAIRALKEKT